MGLAGWVFSDPTEHLTADGRHTFYRVVGRSGYTNAYGWPADGFGMLRVDVTGEGATPEDALRAAMRLAVEQDETAAAARASVFFSRHRNSPW